MSRTNSWVLSEMALALYSGPYLSSFCSFFAIFIVLKLYFQKIKHQHFNPQTLFPKEPGMRHLPILQYQILSLDLLNDIIHSLLYHPTNVSLVKIITFAYNGVLTVLSTCFQHSLLSTVSQNPVRIILVNFRFDLASPLSEICQRLPIALRMKVQTFLEWPIPRFC